MKHNVFSERAEHADFDALVAERGALLHELELLKDKLTLAPHEFNTVEYGRFDQINARLAQLDVEMRKFE